MLPSSGQRTPRSGVPTLKGSEDRTTGCPYLIPGKPPSRLQIQRLTGDDLTQPPASADGTEDHEK